MHTTITIADDGTGFVTVADQRHPFAAPSVAEARNEAITLLQNIAQQTGTPITAAVEGENLSLTVHPDGRVDEHAKRSTPSAPAMPSRPPQSPHPAPAEPANETPAEPAPAPLNITPAEPAPAATAPMPAAVPQAPGGQAAPAPAPAAAPSFVKPETPTPERGIQSVIYKLTGGLLNPGPGKAEQYRAGLTGRIQQGITGTRNVTFMCLKGGISKTSTTLGVGLTLAEHRPDHVLAIDANPDAGDLADRALSHERVAQLSPRTITDLVQAIDDDKIHNLTDLNRFTQTSGRLHLIAGEQDPAVSESLTAEEYESVRSVTDRFYPLTLTDCGTGVTHPAMKGILDNTQQIVVTSGWAVTGAKRAEQTLKWLHAAHDGAYAELAANAVLVLTDTGTATRSVNREQIIETLGSLCRAVHLVPFDASVAKGDLVRLQDLRPQTRQAYLEIGATLVDGLV